MLFERIKQASMKAAMSPTAMKLLSDPRVQKVMMKAIQLPGDVRQKLEKNGQNIAQVLSLVTKDELLAMRRTIRDLQSQVEKLTSELENERTHQAAAPPAPKPTAGGNGDAGAVAAKPAAKKKISVKRKAPSAMPKAAAKAAPRAAAAKPKKKIAVKRKVAVKRKR